MTNFLNRYLFISRRELKVRSVKLPPFKSISAVVLTFFLLASVILFTSGFFANALPADEKNRELTEENVKLKRELADLKEEILRVNGRLATVISMNNEIRDIADLPRLDDGFFSIEGSLTNLDQASVSGGTLDDVSATLKLLEKNIDIQSHLNKEISSAFMDKTSYLRGIPSIMPLDAPFNRTSFGPRKNPITGQAQFHTGLDMGSVAGQEIIATADGVVEKAEVFSGYGLCVIIDHGTGYKTLYGHCSKILVSKGDRVSRGDKLALVGSTGLSTGPHLHYEVIYNGEHLNPADFFFDGDKSFFEKKRKK